jgi:hypothetical protein
MCPYRAFVFFLNVHEICHTVHCHIVKVSKNWQKIVNSCQQLSKFAKILQKVDPKLSKSWQKIVLKVAKSCKKIVKNSETGRRRRRRKRRRFVAPRPGTTLSHLVNSQLIKQLHFCVPLLLTLFSSMTWSRWVWTKVCTNWKLAVSLHLTSPHSKIACVAPTYKVH